MLSIAPQTSCLVEQNCTPEARFFHTATRYAVYEDTVGGSSVTICTDLRLFRLKMLQCQ